MLINGAPGGSTDCLSLDFTEETLWKNKGEVGMMSCQDAIAIGDGREIFVLELNLELTVFKNNMCVEAIDGLVADCNKL